MLIGFGLVDLILARWVSWRQKLQVVTMRHLLPISGHYPGHHPSHHIHYHRCYHLH